MSFSITEADDLTPFAWIEAALRSPMGESPEGDAVLRTLDVIPPSFVAYAKVFHAIYEDPSRAKQDTTWDEAQKSGEVDGELPPLDEAREGSRLVRTGVGGAAPRGWRRVRWSELAEQLGVPYGAQLSARDLDRASWGRSWPARLVGPDEGDLGPDMLHALLLAIRDEGDPGTCYFWWWLVACLNNFDSEDIRDFLFRGRLPDLPQFLDAKSATSPTCWWPERREWCVATDWDLCFTVVGGSESLIARVLASPEIEGLALRAEDTILTHAT